MEDKKKELQQKFIYYQMLNNQIQNLQEQEEEVHRRLLDIETTKFTLNELEKISGKEETLVPIGSGIFAYGRLESTEEVLVSLGSDVLCKKTLEEARKLLDERKGSLEKTHDLIEDDTRKLSSQLSIVGPEVEKLAADIKKTEKS